ncbi:hypothetical protein PV682_32015 [Streptomyces niveiscabiei]|uniref:hypothetical protein n=1 Tax=Streptomyces niveiscabiei TaxID=164115 RepID=UPI0029A79949|nr:hypothetical protein [Streptomyces niveiscabiei]MDX3386050.1 hypothetical protein [Streptomyces niveiscabiei]
MYDNGTHSLRADGARLLDSEGRTEHEALCRLVRDALEVLTGRKEADPFVGREEATAVGTIGALMCVAENTRRLTVAVEAAVSALRVAPVDGHADGRRPHSSRRKTNGQRIGDR